MLHNFRGASVEQRKCRFQHESNLTHYHVYTRNICYQECRLNLVYRTCKCIPHFYPNRSKSIGFAIPYHTILFLLFPPVKYPKTVCNYKILRECFVQHARKFWNFFFFFTFCNLGLAFPDLFVKLYEMDAAGHKETVKCYCAQNCRDSIVNKRSKYVSTCTLSNCICYRRVWNIESKTILSF